MPVLEWACSVIMRGISGTPSGELVGDAVDRHGLQARVAEDDLVVSCAAGSPSADRLRVEQQRFANVRQHFEEPLQHRIRRGAVRLR